MQLALLHKLPPEAWDDDERCGSVVVLMVGDEKEALAFLQDYEPRLSAAVAEFEAWCRDTKSGIEWDETFDAKYKEICSKYSIACLIDDGEFEFSEVEFDAISQ